MKTTQAWGWLTAGVLALGLNGIYHDAGGAQWAHRIVQQALYRAAAVLEPASGHVDQLLANAQMVAARTETKNCRLAATVARIQTAAARSHSGMARIEAMSAREQAQLARLEANRARIEAQAAGAQFATMDFKPIEFTAPRIHMACPRVRVVVPPMPAMKPIRVEMSGAGPI
jgi:hypothetical protein